ncbi:MAG: RNB domain-containing ribonuclease, partial [Myxococcota bacterium]
MKQEEEPRRYRGRVAVHHRGFGFVDLDDHPEVESAFVAPPDLNPFLADDEVTVTLQEPSAGRFQVGEISLRRRTRTTLFGETVRHKGQLYLRVDRQVSNTDWRLRGAEGYDEGTHVVAAIEGGEAKLVRAVDVGPAGLARVLHRYRIRTEFGPDVMKQARRARRGDEPRQDLRDIVTLTIDAPSSRDLDDALSVLPADEQGALRLLVSIADVDALVPRGGELDREARRRGTSVYLAGHVIPMLPRERGSTGLRSGRGEASG